MRWSPIGFYPSASSLWHRVSMEGRINASPTSTVRRTDPSLCALRALDESAKRPAACEALLEEFSSAMHTVLWKNPSVTLPLIKLSVGLLQTNSLVSAEFTSDWLQKHLSESPVSIVESIASQRR